MSVYVVTFGENAKDIKSLLITEFGYHEYKAEALLKTEGVILEANISLDRAEYLCLELVSLGADAFVKETV